MPEYEDENGYTYDVSFKHDFANGRYVGDYMPRELFVEMLADYRTWREKQKTRYHQYLASEEWARKKKAALERAEYKCARCGSGSSLHVHHRHYDHVRKEHESDLIVLCARCHALAHEDPWEYHGRVVGGEGWRLRKQGRSWD